MVIPVRWLLLILAAVSLTAAESPLAGVVARLGSADRLAGQDGWVFLAAELRSYHRGPFWGEAAKALYPQARQPDPLQVIADARRQAVAAGAELVVVPVPGKCVVYPDRLPAPALAASPDTVHRAALAELAALGVPVVDPTEAFRALRSAGRDPFLRGDSHWSPAGLAAAAGLVAARFPAAAGSPAAGTGTFPTREVTITGDLGGTDSVPLEQPLLDGVPPANDPASPVVVIGDSHGLVFSVPINRGIQVAGAGFAEHLAARLGRRVDNLARQGDGANQSREELRDRGDRLAGKRLIVWVFRSSLLTEHDDPRGWRMVRMIPKG